jgi:endoglucanase
MDLDGTEQLWTKPAKNYAKTAVYRLDFSDFSTPGTYRVCIDGIGCSYPFEIASNVWEKAFLIQMKGLYNNRSGVEIGPPYSTFKKPRDFHPDDGLVVTRSTFDVAAKGQYNTQGVPAEDTHEAVTNVWGGYHDAGDWNPRRVTHMITTLAQLELVEIHPKYVQALNLNIPTTPGLPDIITEALFEIDCFRRLQLPDGGIPYGIESQTDPRSGEVSWLSTQHLYVLAPNMRDSWLYAAVAARAAKVLRPLKPELAKVYEDSAARAFAWGEAEYARQVAAKTLEKVQDLWQAHDARNLSSLVLYDLTGEAAYHQVFLEGTCLTHPGEDLCAWGSHIQTDAAFLYARMDDAKADPKIKLLARAAVLKLADDSLAYAAGNAFGITCREKGRPMFAGFFSVSGGMELARAHYLTGKREYLAGAVQSCQFSLGCNPNNLVYTTGLGSNPVRHPLHLDSRSSGQSAPVGLTVFGNADIWNFRGSFWDINLQFANKPDHLWPNAYDWPLPEAYFDVWLLVSTNEFVIDTWQQNVFVWGYLAARP